ncbi:MAG TPA: DUF3971 domain-containing protein, partial [Cellvibrionaceae bacterium]
MRRVLRYLLRKFYLLLAISVICLAVLVQLGRTFSYMAADYQPQLVDYISRQLQAEVSLGSVNAEWEGLQPVLDVTDIRIANYDGEQLLALDSARIRLDLQTSMFRRQLVWGNLSFRGAHLGFHQQQDGRWQLAGINPEASGAVSDAVYHRLLDILLAAKRIAFEQTQFTLGFYQGQTLELTSPSLLLENAGDFHRLQLQLGLPERADALFFIAESEGDPRHRDTSISAYLQLRDVPTDTPMTALSALLAGSVEGLPIEVHGGRLDTSLWLSRDASINHYKIAGDMAIGAFSLSDVEGDVGTIDGFNAAVLGHFSHPGDWRIGLQDGQLWVDEARLDHWNLSLSSTLDEALQIHFDRLPLAPFTDMVMRSEALYPYPELVELLQDLNPQGVVDNLWLRLPFGSPADWSVAANLRDVKVSSWGQVPAFDGVNGYLYSTASHGYFQLDSPAGFSASFEDVYHHPLSFESARGQVGWSIVPGESIYINSGRMQVGDGDEHAEGYFWLSLPWQRNSGDIDLTIYLGARQVSAGQYKKYMPALLPDYIREWVASSIGNQNPGIATAGGFVFRGTINSAEAAMSSFQLALDITDGELDYFPGWPGLKDISGSLLVDDDRVDGILNRGRIYNSHISNGRIKVADNPAGEGPLLSISGEVDGIASDGLRILRQSVLRQYVGNNMDNWYLHGSLKGEVAVNVPLVEDQPGQWQDLTFDVDASSFALDNFNLELKNFNGRIRYNSDSGIQSDTLRAELFGEPADIVFDTSDSHGARATTVDVNTEVSAAQLQEWTQLPLLSYVKGSLPLKMHLALNHNDAEQQDQDARIAAVSVEAKLDQVEIDLPAPLGKPAGQAQALVINYILGTETALADIHYGNRLRALLLVDTDTLTLKSGVIGNRQDLQLPLEPVLAITGHLPALDIGAWQRAYGDYQQQYPPTDTAVPALTSLPPLQLDLTLDEHVTGDITWRNARVQARQQPDAWDVLFTSDQANGELYWPLSRNQHVNLRLQRLSLQRELIGGDEVDDSLQQQPSPSIAPSLWEQLRSAEVSIEWLELDGQDFGSWQFTLQPYREQLAFVDIMGQLRGLQIGGTEHQGAYMLWYNDANAPYTGISARVSAGDLGGVFDAWEMPRSIESERAQFDLNLFWGGTPADFSLGFISGSVNASVVDGRFLRTGDSPGQGLLRLLGLFNFDSLARRLRLDFSDLYKSGLTFDEITGEVAFD